MLKNLACFCGALVVVFFIGFKVWKWVQPKPSEVIIFSVIGERPYSDAVLTIWPNGANLELLLEPKDNRSYLGASGNSLQGSLVVAVHENSLLTQKPENHLFRYDIPTGSWRRVLAQDGIEGYGVISPDGSQLVLEFEQRTTTDVRGQGRLWIVDMVSGDARMLTNDQKGTWDTLPTWRSDGQEVAFLRCQLTTKGVMTKLMSISIMGGEPRFLADGVVDACYSPNGERMAIVADGGLQIWDPITGTRKVILPWKDLPNHQYLAVGLTWSQSQNKIALGLTNRATGASELWTISSDGMDAKKIFSTTKGRINYPSFISR